MNQPGFNGMSAKGFVAVAHFTGIEGYSPTHSVTPKWRNSKTYVSSMDTAYHGNLRVFFLLGCAYLAFMSNDDHIP